MTSARPGPFAPRLDSFAPVTGAKRALVRYEDAVLRSMTRKMLGSAAAAVDRVATAAVTTHAARSHKRGGLSHSERLATLERLEAKGRSGDLADFFTEPRAINPVGRPVRRLASGVEVTDWSWPSDFRPRDPDVSERYLAKSENRIAVCRSFTRGSGRPTALLIHGYMAGSFALEERLWPVPSFDELGYDVVLFTLPFHGLRARAKASALPEFPARDPRITLEAFRQAIFDLRGLTLALGERGHARLGVVGMSLGGYTAALLATLEPKLDFVVPVIPLASLADFAREQGSLAPEPQEAAREHALLEAIYRPVSPTARPSLVEPAGALVVAAKADRITPSGHARRLAQHLRAPLHAFYGGHLLQFGRRESFGAVADLLRERTRHAAAGAHGARPGQ